MIKIIGKHIARSDAGETYQVVGRQEFIDGGTKDGEDWIPGRQWWTLSDGSDVNRIDERTWEIVSTGIILTRLR